jgi:hypothetical protein
MARIELERKPRPVWPWIVALVGLLVLGWLAWSMFGEAPGEEAVVRTTGGIEGTPTVTEQPAPAPAGEVAGVTGGAVERFARTCGTAPATTSGREGPAFELACLREMTNALASQVLADTIGAARLDDELRELRRRVQEAERDRLSVEEDPGRFGEIARSATDLMEALERTRASGAQVSEEHLARARRAADQLRAGVSGAEARRSAGEYFSASADALRGMERSRRG